MTSEKPKRAKEVALPTNDQNLDASVEMSFPASDPPSFGGVTKLKKTSSADLKPSVVNPAQEKNNQNSKKK